MTLIINNVKTTMNWLILDKEEIIYLTNAVTVPAEIELEGSEIRWNPQDANFVTKEVKKELLLDFARLVLVGSESILEFARSWGVLGLCEHGLPATHNPAQHSLSGQVISVGCEPTGKESVQEWQEYARKIRAVLNVAAQIRKGEVGRREDWLVLGMDDEQQPKEIRASEILIEKIANTLLDLVNVRPRLQMNPAGITISHPANSSLFGVIAIQVAQHVAGTNGPLLCSACGELYELLVIDRRPRAGERNYCFECRGTAARRDASRDYRRRKKAE